MKKRVCANTTSQFRRRSARFHPDRAIGVRTHHRKVAPGQTQDPNAAVLGLSIGRRTEAVVTTLT